MIFLGEPGSVTGATFQVWADEGAPMEGTGPNSLVTRGVLHDVCGRQNLAGVHNIQGIKDRFDSTHHLKLLRGS